MLKSFIWALTLVAVAIDTTAQSDEHAGNIADADVKAYEVLRIPSVQLQETDRPIVVAVIDDAFRLDHQAIASFIYTNNAEVPDNGTDDDGNGLIDDVHGWDVADNDADASVVQARESTFYHGTMVASIVAQVAERAFGHRAKDRIRILPYKVVSDRATGADYTLGYNAIDQAVAANADIIICAWGGGRYDNERFRSVFDEAQRNGILILGATGNFFSDLVDPPASISTVHAVAAVDTTGRKMPQSNYGPKVDMVGIGAYVLAAHPQGKKTYGYLDGTSAAVALVGGCAAILKAARPDATADIVMDALMNTAKPVDERNTFYAGRLGAGLPNLEAAYDYIMHKENQHRYFNEGRTMGELILSGQSTGPWNIEPAGGHKGYHFSVRHKVGSPKAVLKFFSEDTLRASYRADELPSELFVKGNGVRVEAVGKLGRQPTRIVYRSVPIDSTSLYCSDIRYFENSEGVITDGSGPQPYAPNCDCKWLITVAEGKRMKIWFDEFDTEGKIDFVHLFAGDATLQENILAKFSGSDLPPVIVSTGNQVLVWFVTSQTHHGQGWRLNYSITEEEPGVYPPGK
jgi:hypothetical protein